MIKVVIIDDDKSLIKVIKEMIEMSFRDASVYTAYDGKEGLQLIKKRMPDLVIVDLNIPSMNGHELCDYMKKSNTLSLIPVLMITGSRGGTQTRVDSFNAGADGFVSKPFEKSELIARANALINLKIAEDRLVRQRDILQLDVNLKEKELKKRYYELKQFFSSFIQVMATTIDSLSIYNYNSTKKVADLVLAFIAYINSQKKDKYKYLHFTADEAEDIVTAAWLHDIGKILLPPGLLNKTTRLGDSYHIIMQRVDTIYYWNKSGKKGLADKIDRVRQLVDKYNDPLVDLDNNEMRELTEIASLTYKSSSGEIKHWLTSYELECLTIGRGTLTDGERVEVKKHVQLTDLLLSKIPFPHNKKRIREWASAHHELLDGTGYWKGLKGNEIPLQARILTIIDIFEAMVSTERIYRKRYNGQQAINIIELLASEGKLDKDLVELFKESGVWKNV